MCGFKRALILKPIFLFIKTYTDLLEYAIKNKSYVSFRNVMIYKSLIQRETNTAADDRRPIPIQSRTTKRARRYLDELSLCRYEN